MPITYTDPDQPQPAPSPSGGGDWVGALIGAGTAIYTTVEQKKAQERQNKANMELAAYQYDEQRKMWDAQNLYNDPSAQLARYRAAGLSPNLIYGGGAGGGSAGNASDYPKYQAPHIQQEFANPQTAITGVISAYQDYRVKQAQINNIEATAENTRARTMSEALRPKWLQTNTEIAEDKRDQLRYIYPYQAAIQGNAARSSEAKLQQDWKRLSLMGQEEQMNMLRQSGQSLENEKRETEILFNKYRNQWMQAGITSSDNLVLRLFTRMLSENGFTPSSAGMAAHKFITRQK